jgi:hypothetical protein
LWDERGRLKETKMKTSERLEKELGQAEAIGQFVAECEVAINQFSPKFEYHRSDLSGFVRAAWPCDGEPADVAVDFLHNHRSRG